MDNIENEIRYYKANRMDFINMYDGKHLVIKGMEIIGIYNSHSEAQEETAKLHEKGSYIIEHPMDMVARRFAVKKVKA